jgi:Rhs family protein
MTSFIKVFGLLSRHLAALGGRAGLSGKTRRVSGFAEGLVALLAMVGEVRAETVTYYYTNQQGTPLVTADSAGNILTSADYRPYGTRALGVPDAGPGYTGHINDPDSGLVYMQARYYDPGVGRFLSTDPVLSEPGSLVRFGRFAYANNNPITNVDPDGRVAIVTRMKDGSVRVQYPVAFTGKEASDANKATFKAQVADMSGTYHINGADTKVSFEVTGIKTGLFSGTPSKAQNAIELMKGPTSDPTGRSNADVGGNHATIRTDDRFDEGIVKHEMMHIGGLDDIKDPSTGGIVPGNNDIMNRVPGEVSSSDVEKLINYKGNVHRDESK